jgi:hypothetical protein
MSFIKDIAHTDSHVLVKGTPDGKPVSVLWFKTPPVDRDFCYRAAQLQLCTDSCDQGPLSAGVALDSGNTWFEVAIYANADATEPRKKDDKPLTWTSHFNRPQVGKRTRHFGAIYDRRGDLLDELIVSHPDPLVKVVIDEG